MPKIDRHAPGSFCWVELGTIDQAGARRFYSTVFGWSPVDFPIGPNETYTMFQVDGADVAAAYTMRDAELAMAPPHWNLYVAVESADETAKRAGELGGTVIAAPFDVMSFGRMAVIQDPTGAVFCVWQARDHTGTRLAHENATMCWADLTTSDPDRARQFYEGLFGWKIAAMEKYPPDYLVIRNGNAPIGGVPPEAYRQPGIAPHWMLFFQMEDVDAAVAKAKELGGAVHLAPMSMGGVRLAVLADAQGAAFSIIKRPV